VSTPAGCTYYSIDIEASGPIPGRFNLVSLGATVIHERPTSVLQIGPSIELLFRPVFEGQDPEANRIHQIPLERLMQDGLEPTLALRRLSDFVRSTTDPGTKATFVGHVAVFDWMFVAWYYHWFGIENPFGYKAIDTKSMAIGALHLNWLDTGKETLDARLGLAAQPDSTLHNAQADASHQAQLFVALMKKIGLANEAPSALP
jgi:DNA polymerase III epsilon subunit-like protein